MITNAAVILRSCHCEELSLRGASFATKQSIRRGNPCDEGSPHLAVIEDKNMISLITENANSCCNIICLGIAGIIINRKHIIVLLMSIELILLAVNTNFIAFSLFSEKLRRSSICISGTNSSCRRSCDYV